jgi:predicted ATPase/Tfp pilus assembly protein PilF
METLEAKEKLEIQSVIQPPTKLHTLSGLRLEHTNFTRPKPLLLLVYLCLEGKQEKRFLAELFWQGASNHLNSLSKALSQLRQVGVVDNDDSHAWATVSSDISEFFEALEHKDFGTAVTLYQSSFLSGFYLSDWGVELEEWVYSTREYLASRMREALLGLAEKSSDVTAAMKYAERAYELETSLEPDLLPRLYKFLAHTPHATKLKQEAKEFGISLGQAKTISSHLPTRGTSFIGRDIERLELGELLSQSDVRLLTLVGQGGVGKTRLALEVAREAKENFRDGLVFIALEPFTTSEQALSSFSSIFGVALDKCDDVTKIAEAIGDKHLLILLDNFEHLVHIASSLSTLLSECPNLKILVTSRARLELEEEWIYGLEGFSLSEKMSLETAQLNDAVTLFVQRARKVKQGFALSNECLPFVLTICRRVEGLPLGIELAASWAKTLSCQEIAENLEDLDFLTTSLNNIPERQQSLRVVFEGSWNLLTKEEQNVLSNLSVFRAGFTSEAAHEVVRTSLLMLARLVDKSLLRVTAQGRYDFHPLLQEYCREKLTQLGQDHETCKAHAAYFLNFAEKAKPHLEGPEQSAFFKKLEADFGNFRAAFTWLSAMSSPEVFRLFNALSRFFIAQGYAREASGWADEMVARIDNSPSLESANFLNSAGALARALGDYRKAQRFYEDSLSSWQKLGREADETRVIGNLGVIAYVQGDYALAQQNYELVLARFRKANHTLGVAKVLHNLGALHAEQGHFDEAVPRFQESLALARQHHYNDTLACALDGLGTVFYEWGDFETAMLYLQESLTIIREVGDKRFLANTLQLAGRVAHALGDVLQARSYLCEGLDLQQKIDNKPGMMNSLEGLASLLLESSPSHAVSLWGVVERFREDFKFARPPREVPRYTLELEKAKEKLGEAKFKAAWTRGQTMSLEGAVSLALQNDA